MAKTLNRNDYTYMARLTHGKVVTFFQDKGARVHFNYKVFNDPALQHLTNGSKSQISLRYGIVQYDDMIRDLKYWETLLSSSFMQRPHEILTENKLPDELIEA